MGLSASQIKKTEKRRNSILHSGEIYTFGRALSLECQASNTSLNRFTKAKSSKSDLKTSSISEIIGTKNLKAQSSNNIKDNLPDNLKQYHDSIRVLYEFWNDNIEILSIDEYKKTCILFYLTLFSAIPEARSMFMKKKIELQGTQYFGMIGWLIKTLIQPNPERLINSLKELGAMHQEMNVKLEWYDIMLESLHETLTDIIGTNYTMRVRFCMSQLFDIIAGIMNNKDFNSFVKNNKSQIPLTNFIDCYDHPKGRVYLQMFMKEQFCIELLYFYQRYRKYKACMCDIEKRIVTKQLMYNFVMPQSKCEVNISYTCRKALIKAYHDSKTGIMPHDFFDKAASEVQHLINTSVWSKFTKNIELLLN